MCICDAIATHALSALNSIYQHFQKCLLLKAFRSAHSGRFHLFIFESISLLSVSFSRDIFLFLSFVAVVILLADIVFSFSYSLFLIRHPLTPLSNIGLETTPAPYKTY